KAVELNPDDGFSHQIRGEAEVMLKNYNDALLDFDKAIELTPQAAEAYAGRGSLKVLAHDFDGANADLEKALQLNPKSAPAFAGRGFLRIKRGDNNGALADFQQAVKLGSQYAQTYQCLGYLQDDLFQFRPALENLRKSVEMDPSMDYPRFRIWLIRSRLGERDDATKELDSYVKSLPGAKAQDWSACIGHFLTGSVPEGEFFNQATATAKRPSDTGGQICEACYYAGMKHLLDGDKEGAADLFQKCLDTGATSYSEFSSASAELRALKQP